MMRVRRWTLLALALPMAIVLALGVVYRLATLEPDAHLGGDAVIFAGWLLPWLAAVALVWWWVRRHDDYAAATVGPANALVWGGLNLALGAIACIPLQFWFTDVGSSGHDAVFALVLPGLACAAAGVAWTFVRRARRGRGI